MYLRKLQVMSFLNHAENDGVKRQYELRRLRKGRTGIISSSSCCALSIRTFFRNVVITISRIFVLLLSHSLSLETPRSRRIARTAVSGVGTICGGPTGTLKVLLAFGRSALCSVRLMWDQRRDRLS
jgi:hypothetical protein